MAKEILMSRSALEHLENELKELTTVKRTEIAEKLKEARSHGDLSENSEYDAAKNEQAIMEARIAELEAMLPQAKVIDESDISTDHITIGCKVRILDVEFNEEEEYTIVNVSEADVENGRISDESPVGKGLFGKKVGETVTIKLPTGATVDYKVLSIEMNRDIID